LEIVTKGGYVIVVIMLCSLVAVAVMIERWLYYRQVEKDNALMDRMRQAAVNVSGQSSAVVKSVLDEVIALECPRLEQNLYILVTIATISPLLGLLGTVFGMIKTFHVTAVSGVGNPQLLAEGISEALYNTAGGLLVTIPCIVANYYYRNRAERLLQKADGLQCAILRDIQSGGSKGET